MEVFLSPFLTIPSKSHPYLPTHQPKPSAPHHLGPPSCIHPPCSHATHHVSCKMHSVSPNALSYSRAHVADKLGLHLEGGGFGCVVEKAVEEALRWLLGGENARERGREWGLRGGWNS